MTGFAEHDLTRNDFLGGRVRLWQPHKGYRAGVDPVYLAASVPARAGQSVLELGCGAGAAILCLAARVGGMTLTGVELQPAYAELAHRNGEENGVGLEVVEADLAELPIDLRQRQFDHVIANPPYFRAGAHSPSKDAGRHVAMGERTPLDTWIAVGAKRLAPRGYLHMIQRADRLPEMLAACTGRLGSVEVLPLSPRLGRAPELLILRAQKGGRAAFVLHAPVILHMGEKHLRDEDHYTPEIAAVQREGAPMQWPKTR